MKKATFGIVIVALTIILLSSKFLYATAVKGAGSTYYVSPTGSDTNNGASTAPWKTLTKASSVASAGDTVIALPGSYSENFTLGKSGSSGSQITFNGQNGAVVTGTINIKASYVTLQNFEIIGNVGVWGSYNIIEGNYLHDSPVAHGIVLNSSPKDGTESTYDIVRNNRIYRAVQTGIYVEGQYHLIENNDISHTQDHTPGSTTGAGDADGIHFFGKGHIFRKNYIHDLLQSEAVGLPHIDDIQTYATAYNIIFDSNIMQNPNTTGSNRVLMLERQPNTGPVSDITFVNNIFILEDDSSSFLNFHRKTELSQPEIVNMVVINNVFYKSTGIADQPVTFTSITNPVFQNNLLINAADNNSSYASMDSGTTGAIISNNDIYNPAGAAYTKTTYLNDLVNVDPKVVNYLRLDFHPTSTSPLIDKGVVNSYTSVDKDGNTRPVGNGYDIGAYEYGGSVSVTPSPTAIPSPTPTIKPGDANGDNLVNEADYSIWLSHYGMSVSGISNGDFNGDSKVDGVDYSIWVNYYGR